MQKGAGREKFLGQLIMSTAEIEHVHAAYVFAKYGHHDQTRDGGGRYFDHPKEVANIIIRELGIKNNWKIIVTALLHDILEDTYLLSEHTITRLFGRNVALWVALLSKVPKDGYHERLAASGLWGMLLIKICERLHKLRPLGVWDAKRKSKYLKETAEWYMPLAGTLVARIPRKYVFCAKYLKTQIEVVLQ